MLHVNGGVGRNQLRQQLTTSEREIISMTCSIAKEAITNFYNQNFPASITMADLGCSSGSNTLMIVSNMITQVEEIRQNKLHKKPLEYQIFLNDLHGNDFNAIFTSLPNFLEDLRTQIGGDFGLCFFNGVPGSFYAKLFPSNTLHFLGIVEEKMADSFNIPSYMPSPREVETEVVKEGICRLHGKREGYGMYQPHYLIN